MPTETNWRKNVCSACNTHHPNGWACPKDLAVVREDNVRLREEITRLRDELQDIRDGNQIILDEKCASDEVHCGCVPTLRKEIERLREALEEIARGHGPRQPARELSGDHAREIARAALHTEDPNTPRTENPSGAKLSVKIQEGR